MLSTETPSLSLSDYDYPLPEDLIARYPLPNRDSSRMLVMDRQTGAREHRQFRDLPEFLKPGDLLVVNNTQVLPARLLGHRHGHTGRIEVLLLHPDASDPTLWSAMTRPTRKLKVGTIIEFPNTTSTVEIAYLGEGVKTMVKIHLRDQDSVADLMEAIGHMPIPPYLKRDAEDSDKSRYQTVYAKNPGAQAAPTAGLHFTDDVLQQLKSQGVQIAEVTLAVSSGTFRSVDTEDITQHVMDPEFYTVAEETAQLIQTTKANGGRVIAVGTTVAKTLETAAKTGSLEDWSRLFIYPGFKFQVVNMMLTNFHLPKTTLMMLVSAFAGRESIMHAYEEALKERYRFFSYGDCMLLA